MRPMTTDPRDAGTEMCIVCSSDVQVEMPLGTPRCTPNCEAATSAFGPVAWWSLLPRGPRVEQSVSDRRCRGQTQSSIYPAETRSMVDAGQAFFECREKETVGDTLAFFEYSKNDEIVSDRDGYGDRTQGVQSGKMGRVDSVYECLLKEDDSPWADNTLPLPPAVSLDANPFVTDDPALVNAPEFDTEELFKGLKPSVSSSPDTVADTGFMETDSVEELFDLLLPLEGKTLLFQLQSQQPDKDVAPVPAAKQSSNAPINEIVENPRIMGTEETLISVKTESGVSEEQETPSTPSAEEVQRARERRRAAIERRNAKRKLGKRENKVKNEEVEEVEGMEESDVAPDSPPQDKKEARRLRNRESAALSRKRRRENVDSLQQMVRELSEMNAGLTRRVVDLEREIAALRNAKRQCKCGDVSVRAEVGVRGEVGAREGRNTTRSASMTTEIREGRRGNVEMAEDLEHLDNVRRWATMGEGPTAAMVRGFPRDSVRLSETEATRPASVKCLKGQSKVNSTTSRGNFKPAVLGMGESGGKILKLNNATLVPCLFLILTFFQQLENMPSRLSRAQHLPRDSADAEREAKVEARNRRLRNMELLVTVRDDSFMMSEASAATQVGTEKLAGNQEGRLSRGIKVIRYVPRRSCCMRAGMRGVSRNLLSEVSEQEKYPFSSPCRAY